MPDHRVTMQDVAAHAGVSRATASYVLNGRPEAIPAETQERVQAAARGLGYRVNRLARNLTRRRSGLVGIVLPDLKSPFFGQLAEHVHAAVSATGYQPLFRIGPAAPEDQATRAVVLEQLLEWGADGILIWWEPGAFPDALCDDYRHAAGPTPLVFLGSGPPPAEDADAVWFDLYAAGRLAADHVAGRGHRRVAVLGGKRVAADPRYHGVRDALVETGLPAPELCADDSDPAAHPVTLAPLTAADPLHPADLGSAVIERRMAAPDRPSAVIAVNDLTALGALHGIARAGLRVPEDVSLVSCDETWVAAHLNPPLTAVAMPFATIAERGAALLERRLRERDGKEAAGEGPLAEHPCRMALAPVLQTRASVLPPVRTDDGPDAHGKER